MKTITAMLLGLAVWTFANFAQAQDAKPYKEGQVTAVSYIKIKPGKFEDYMRFLATSYKSYMEATKKAGLIVGYGVYSAQAKSPREPDLILTVTYANMAALDKTEENEAVAAKVIGSTAVQNKAYVDREAMREVLGSELIRELVLK